MAKNEEGDFELILGNNQLLSVFFLMVLLLALCFVGGYLVGRNAAPMLTAGGTTTPETTFTPSTAEPAQNKIEITRETPAPPESKAPVRTASQSQPDPAPTPKETAKAAPPPAKPEPPKAAKAEPPKAASSQGALPPISSQPIAGRVYLQLSATGKDPAEAMADLVRRAGMPAIAAAITDRPDLYRVLVGPLADNAIDKTKADLKAAGFPADAAIRRVF